MQSKEAKKSKINNNQNSNAASNNKHIEENILINKLIQKNRNSKTMPNNNSNSNILRMKTQETKINTSSFNPNKISKNNTNVEKEKKARDIHMPVNAHDKTNNDKKINNNKSNISTKQKTPNKINPTDKSKKIKITKKNTVIYESKKNPFLKQKSNHDYLNNNNTNDKRKKSDNGCYNTRNELKKKNNKLDEKGNEFNTQKLLEFLISLSPIDTSKCDDLISNNMSKIIELENKIADISKMTQYEIIKLTSDENNESNKITTKQNLEIINKESKMRKDIYKLFFDFITDLLEQINKLSNNIAGKESNYLNLKDNTSSSNDGLFVKNNVSDLSNNSLFISNIEEEFCEKLINITKSFISSDIDLNDLKSNFDSEDKKLYEKDDIFKDDDKIIIDYNNSEYNSIAKKKNKNIFMVHPNEILDKIQNENKKDKKVIHHYSNSLKVNSNLEKLEGKVNNDDDTMNNDTISNIGNLEKLKNCNIF